MRKIVCPKCRNKISVDLDDAGSFSCPHCRVKINLTALTARRPAMQVKPPSLPPIVELEYPADVANRREEKSFDFSATPLAQPKRGPYANERSVSRSKHRSITRPRSSFPWRLTLLIGTGAACALALGLVVVFAWLTPNAPLPAAVVKAAPKPDVRPKPVPPAPPLEQPRIVAPRPVEPPPPRPQADIAPTIISVKAGFDIPPFSVEDQQKRRLEEQNEHRRTMLDGYQKVGKRNAKWDNDVHLAIEAAAIALAAPSEESLLWPKVRPIAQRALDAGCNDELVRYLFAKSFSVNDVKVVARNFEAGIRLAEAWYPDSVRLQALLFATENQLEWAKTDPEANAGAERNFASCFQLLVRLSKDGDPRFRWFLQYYTILTAVEQQVANHGDTPRAIAWMEKMVGNDPELKASALRARAILMTKYGWEARGDGWANTVTPEGWRLFNERLFDAKRSLENAWQLNPGDGQIAAWMIHTCKAIGKDDEVREWFEKAMQADPENVNACKLMLDYLDPKWHGSPELMLGFGRTCRDARKGTSAIPLLIAPAHFLAAQQYPSAERLAYMATDRVWNDIQSVYEEYLTHCPGAEFRRFEFAVYAALCNRPELAGEQFLRVGNNIYPFPHLSQENVQKLRDNAIAQKKQRDGNR